MEGADESDVRVSFAGVNETEESSGESAYREVVDKFREWVTTDAEIGKSVATVKALVEVVRLSRASTMVGLCSEVRSVIDELIRGETEAFRPTLSVQSGSELFLRFIYRAEKESNDLEEVRETVMEAGDMFSDKSRDSRLRIARFAVPFIRDGMVILNHGMSRTAFMIYKRAAAQRIRFTVIATEGRPRGPAGSEGCRMAQKLAQLRIPVRVICDSAVGFFMDQADMVLVGAEAIVESGGIINQVGTLPIAVMAKHAKKPFYVAAESYKFRRFYPLRQRDIPAPDINGPENPFPEDEMGNSSFITTANPRLDLTRPDLITLLFTDLGVLTPSAVSDELIKLFL